MRRCKRKIEKRLERREWADQPTPMLAARNIRYEMAERTRAIDCGAIGAIHLLAQKTGLVYGLNNRLRLLKRHLPYHESDHVLNVAYNTFCGGTCLEDIELRRTNETYLDALDAQRIPDPTTAGDFARRFEESDVVATMAVINDVRVNMWRKKLSWQEREDALIDVDGILAPTTGESKEGMGLSYNGVWGYHPLLVSLANTREPLYTVNRPGNRPSHDGAAEWMNKAAALVRRGGFQRVTFRGDTDFSLTAHFDAWSKEQVRFAFGMDAMPNLVKIAESLEKTEEWAPLARKAPEAGGGASRARRENVKERIVVENEYKNIRLKGEDVAEVAYRPTKCDRDYRLIILRKNLSVEKGEKVLFPDIRYCFYITNIERKEMPAQDVVFFCNERCDQENLIEQLKNGLNALRMPVGDLVSNWAYMVMASLAWTLKAWFAMVTRGKERRHKLIRMEFKRFLNGVVRLPAQIVKTGRRIVYRLLGYSEWAGTLLRTFDAIRTLRLT